QGEITPFAEIPIPASYRMGDVFAIGIRGLDYNDVEYGYRLVGPDVPLNGSADSVSAILMDPYAKAVGGRVVWGDQFDADNPFQHRARIMDGKFDWGHDRPLRIPIEDLVIYEVHVRGFTRHPSAGVKHPG